MKGFLKAIEAVYPQTEVQLCIVHLVRNSLKFVPWKDPKAVATTLKVSSNTSNADEAELRLLEFEEQWSGRYPSIGPIWKINWEHVIPFFRVPDRNPQGHLHN